MRGAQSARALSGCAFHVERCSWSARSRCLRSIAQSSEPSTSSTSVLPASSARYSDRRYFVGSPSARLPRALPPGRRGGLTSADVSREDDAEEEELEASEQAGEVKAGQMEMEQSADLPWFLQAAPVEQEQIVEEAETPDMHSEERARLRQRRDAQIAQLPSQLRGLRDVILESPYARRLVDDDGAEMSRDAPIDRPFRFIHAKHLDEESWTEWIVIVEVDTTTGGAVTGLARTAGEFLSHTRPPAFQKSALDALGAFRDASPRKKGQLREDQDEESPPAANDPSLRPKGVPRISWAAGRELPSWEITRRSLAARAAKADAEDEESSLAWQPRRIISREAQDGLKMLAENDPQLWTAETLAAQFRISKDAVRRILNSKWKVSREVRERQDRRAREREEARKEAFFGKNREQEEMEAIRRALDAGSLGGGDAPGVLEGREEVLEEEQDGLELGQDSRVRGNADEEALSPSIFDNMPEFRHPLRPRRRKPVVKVTYEGIPTGPGTDGSGGGGGLTKAQARRAARQQRGEGDWVLVDAGWCVVHVMTSNSRARWDLERRWNKASKALEKGGASDLAGEGEEADPAVAEMNKTKHRSRVGKRYSLNEHRRAATPDRSSRSTEGAWR